MKIQAESSEILVELDGVPCRVWNAVTEDGEQVFLFVHRIATRAALEEELILKSDPSKRVVKGGL